MSRSSPITLPQEFYEARLITGVDHVVKSGKEAIVYCCRAHPATGAEFLAQGLPGDPQQAGRLILVAVRELQDAGQQDPVHLAVRLGIQVGRVGG